MPRHREEQTTDIRTFIAIPIDPAILARLAAVQQALRAAGAPVSWTRPEGIHLTLKFLGDVPEDRMPDIGTALTTLALAHTAFALSVDGVGGFPTLHRPRVLWAGIGTGGDAAGAVARDIETALTPLGFPPETRPFTPHLTLGRVKAPEGLDRLAALLTQQADAHFGAMRVEAIQLIRSDLSPTGARYTVLCRAPLREAAG